MIKKLWRKLVRAGMQEELTAVPYPVARSRMEELFGNCSPVMVAFKIDNGYVVRSAWIDHTHDGQATGFTYCKDHAAIAEHLVAETAREKMFPQQQSLKYGAAGQMTAKLAPRPYTP